VLLQHLTGEMLTKITQVLSYEVSDHLTSKDVASKPPKEYVCGCPHTTVSIHMLITVGDGRTDCMAACPNTYVYAEPCLSLDNLFDLSLMFGLRECAYLTAVPCYECTECYVVAYQKMI
jgi:hypothetical protein